MTVSAIIDGSGNALIDDSGNMLIDDPAAISFVVDSDVFFSSTVFQFGGIFGSSFIDVDTLPSITYIGQRGWFIKI